MKIRLFAFALILGTLAGCSGGYNGQLLGTQDRPGWNNVIPYGMVYVPSGTLHIGQSDQDLNNAMVQKSKSISIQGFYMDATEVTNNEYRQFVYWVRDSVTAKTLGADFIAVDDDGDVEGTDDKDVDNDGGALSSSSILFSKMKFHINGSAILRNDCVLIPIPFNRGGVVINRPS